MLILIEHAQDAGSGSREHMDLGSSIKHLGGPIYACTRAPLTQRPLYGSTPFMSIEASSWTTSKSIWPSRLQYMVHSFIIFLHHQGSLQSPGSLQHLPLEKQVPGGSAIQHPVCWGCQRLLVLSPSAAHLPRQRGVFLSEITVKKNVSG